MGNLHQFSDTEVFIQIVFNIMQNFLNIHIHCFRLEMLHVGGTECSAQKFKKSKRTMKSGKFRRFHLCHFFLKSEEQFLFEPDLDDTVLYPDKETGTDC